MEYSYYEDRINKNTVGKYDVTPLFSDADVFYHLISDLAEPFRDTVFDKVVGLEALGFILGAALAQHLKKGFICIRKSGKLPNVEDDILRTASFVDYTNTDKSFEINKLSIRKGEKILLVDDWIETGTQMRAAIQLIEQLGGEIVGITCLCAQKNERTRSLFDKYVVASIKK